MRAVYAARMTRLLRPAVGLLALLSIVTPFSASLAQSDAPTSPGMAPAPQGLTGTATTARTTTTGAGVRIELTLSNATTTDLSLLAGRSNSQRCAFPPHVRVLKVGTREVVFPGGEPRLCTQELSTERVGAGSRLTLTRTLELPAGEYMVEVWWQGFANDQPAKVPAEPVRVTVQ